MSSVDHELPHFPTTIDLINQRIDKVDPVAYGRSRNYIDGTVSYLSPYISRGVISTKDVMQRMYDRGYKFEEIEKFIQELAWRDYWQQIWVHRGERINSDLKHIQRRVIHHSMPLAISEANTGIQAIDKAIIAFYKTGYLHNHLRMYTASIACNIAKAHWKTPAKWMYYHLLDGDWASNALSWQWVAGANSNKKYFANQDNINKYTRSDQKGTFLDISYDDFGNIQIPEILAEKSELALSTSLPLTSELQVNNQQPSFIFNSYNLDPLWSVSQTANHILLLESSHFEAYPVSEKVIEFILELSKNIKNIQVYVGEFASLIAKYELKDVHYKEHPLNNHYQGTEHSREWMSPVTGYYASFFKFWKHCKKHLK